MPMVTLALKGKEVCNANFVSQEKEGSEASFVSQESAISAKHADKNDPALKIIVYLQNGNYQKPANDNIATCADIIFASGNNVGDAMTALTDYLSAATDMSVKDVSKALSRLL